MSKRKSKLIILFSLVFLGVNAFPEDWYISNAAGMPLEKTFSRAALREAYALKIETHEPNLIPAEIAEYIDSAIVFPESYRAELHTLYENASHDGGEEKNQRWILRYEKGNPWIVISINEDGGGGFSEYYDESGLLIQEDSFFEDRIVSNVFSYSNEILVKSEIWKIPRKTNDTVSEDSDENELSLTEIEAGQSAESLETETRLWSDVYRYTRVGSLRSVTRTFFSDAEEIDTRLARFSPLGPSYEKRSGIISVPVISSDFISDIINVKDKKIEYVTDEQGRIISEIYTDEEGRKIGELHITWSGERLASIDWNGENDKRRIEYEYDEEGSRIAERNYRDDILERLVRTEGDHEVEELYLQGSLSLRAVWKDGQKVSEEYFRQNLGRSRANSFRRNP